MALCGVSCYVTLCNGKYTRLLYLEGALSINTHYVLNKRNLKMSNAAYEVGRIHVRQEDPPILTRCIQDRPGAFYGIELTSQNGTQRVM